MLPSMLHLTKESCREDFHQDATENPMVEMNAVKNSLESIKRYNFVSKYTIIYENLNFNNDKNWNFNNSK